MKYGWLASLMLLGLALALGSFVLLYERNRPEPPMPEAKFEPAPLIESSEAVVSLRLQNLNGQFTFQRGENINQWLLAEPISGPVEPIYVGLMCNQFLGLKKARIIAEGGEEAEKFGLLDPPMRMTYRFGDNREDLVLEFGNLNPVKDKIYARILGQAQIFLVDRIVYQYRDRGLDDFRYRWLLTGEASNDISLEIRYLDPEVKKLFPRGFTTRLINQPDPQGNSHWMMLEPFQEPVAPDMVNKFHNSVKRELAGKIEEVPNKDFSRYGLDRPAIEVLVENQEHKVERVLLGRPSPEKTVFYALNPDWNLVFRAPAAAMLKAFNQDFRILYLLPPGAEDTFTRVAVSFPSDPQRNYALEKTPSGSWRRQGDSQHQLGPMAVFWVLSSLIEVPGGSFYIYDRASDPDRFGLSRPRTVIQLFEGPREIANLVIGAATSKPTGSYVLDRRRDTLLWVPRDLDKTIPHDPSVFLRPEALVQTNSP